MRRKFAFMALISITGLAACETVEGVGRDIEKGGQAITETAQDAQS